MATREIPAVPANVDAQTRNFLSAVREVVNQSSTSIDAFSGLLKLNDTITNISSDNVLSASEKSAIRQQWDTIAQEKPIIDAQAHKYNVGGSLIVYDFAFTQLANYFNGGGKWTTGVPTWIADNNLDKDTLIVGQTFRTMLQDYYGARLVVNQDITNASTVDTTALAVIKPPTHDPIPHAPLVVVNKDGKTVNVTLVWTIPPTAAGELKADGFYIYAEQGLKPLDTTSSSITVSGTQTSYLFPNLPIENNYRAGIAAFRNTSKGIQVGKLIQPSGLPTENVSWEVVYDTTPPKYLPSSLHYTGGVGTITLNWINPVDPSFDHVDIWFSFTNDVSTATYLASESSNSHTWSSLAPRLEGYVWLTAVNVNGLSSVMFPTTQQGFYVTENERGIIVPPTNDPAISQYSSELNSDGVTHNVTLHWSYSQGKYNADGFFIGWVISKTGSEVVTAATTDYVNITDPAATAHTFTVPLSVGYQAAICAYRDTTQGAECGNIIQGTAWKVVSLTPTTEIFSKTGAPSNAPAFQSVSSTPASATGLTDITVTWNYTQGDLPADHFNIYGVQGTSAPTSASGFVTVACNLSMATHGTQSYTFFGLASDISYTASVVASRLAFDGLHVGVLSALTPTWSYVGKPVTIGGATPASLAGAVTTANNVNSWLTNAVSDGNLSVSELQTIANWWAGTAGESASIVTQANTYKLTTQSTNYSNALQALGNFLNTGHGTWVAPAVPYYVSSTYLSSATISTYGLNIDTNTASTFRGLVATFETARTAVFQGISDANNALALAAQTQGQNANSGLNSMLSDGNLSLSELQNIRGAWDSYIAERSGLINQANNYSLSSLVTTYTAALQQLGDFLNQATWTLGTIPYYISDTFIKTITNAGLSIGANTGANFRSAVANFEAARTAVFQGISDAAAGKGIAAQTTANQALANAGTAQTTANNVNNGLNAILSDGNLSVDELNTISGTWAQIIAEKAGILAQASTYGVSSVNYSNTLTALGTFLNGSSWTSGTPYYVTTAFISTVTTAGLTISATTGADFRTAVNNFETARTALFQAIADVTATRANYSGISSIPSNIAAAGNSPTTTLLNSAITVSGGAIQGIGTGNGTVVDNSLVTPAGISAVHTNLTNAPAGILNSNVTPAGISAVHTNLTNAPAGILNSNVTPASIGAINTSGTNAPTSLQNSAISIGTNGSLSGAGGGQVSLAGLGAGALATVSTLTSGNISSYVAQNAITASLVQSIYATSIAAGTLGAGVVYAGTINASQISCSSLSALNANLGTVTAGNITGTAGINISGNAVFTGSSAYSGYNNAAAVANQSAYGQHGIIGSCGYAGIGVVGIGGAAGTGVFGSSSSADAVQASGQTTLNGNVRIYGQLVQVGSTVQVTNLNAQYLSGISIGNLCQLVATQSGNATISGNGFNITMAGSLAGAYRTVGSGNSVLLTDVSDTRLKKDITPESLGLDFINKLSPVQYRMIADDKLTHHGFIAQDVKELIQEANVDALLTQAEDGYYGVGYTSIISIMTKAIQELFQEVQMLKKQIQVK